MSNTILLTGLAGALGKLMACKLASLGHDVYCLIPVENESEARQRFLMTVQELKESFPQFSRFLESRLQPIPGNIRRKGLGISPALLEKLKESKIKALWHFEELFDLSENRSRDVYETNLVGTLNVLEFAREQGIPELHYLSSFISSGIGEFQDGVVLEIPGKKPRRFTNTYEHTKWETEHHLWHAQIRGEVLTTIYRPGFVIDPAIPENDFPTDLLSHFLNVLNFARIRLCKQQGLNPRIDALKYSLRLPVEENALFNVVSPDFVCDVIAKIISVPRSQGHIYHILNPNPPTVGHIVKIFQKQKPWQGLCLEKPAAQRPSQNAIETEIDKELECFAPYLTDKTVYDASNTQTMLAFQEGLPSFNNEVVLDAILKWSVRKEDPQIKKDRDTTAKADSDHPAFDFKWPEETEKTVHFSSPMPVTLSRTRSNYSLTQRLLGKVYIAREKLFSVRSASSLSTSKAGRDIVIVPFGMGVTRRGEAEQHCYRHNPKLTEDVFTLINGMAGFDLRAFARQELPGHELFADIRDHCSWAVADNMIHLIRLFRDIQRVGGAEWVSRLQILPHSAGTHFAGWLSGAMSLEDTVQMIHQCAHLMSENERLSSLEEVDRWFFDKSRNLSEEERSLLAQIRQKVDPNLLIDREALAEKLHGRLELAYSLNADVFQKLLHDIDEHKIGVKRVITMSPHACVFAGNELEMTRFRNLFGIKGYIALRRMPLEVKGTPHFARLASAARQTVKLLELYHRQGRLRDPIIPIVSYDGEWISTWEKFAEAVAGNADQVYAFDKMIERSLQEGGRHFLLVQSGLSTLTGDLFKGVIQHAANKMGSSPVHLYSPAAHSSEPHPICKSIAHRPKNQIPNALDQSLAETILWYESHLGIRNT